MANPELEFHRLYERFYAEVFAFCARRVDRAEAEDVAAEVFVAAWRRIGDMDVGSERAWLFGIARNLTRNQWRSNSRRVRLFELIRQLRPVEMAPPEQALMEGSSTGVVLEALATLRPSDREILVLSAWDGLDGSEIAGILRISPNTAYQRLHRAKQRLARAIEQLGDPAQVEAIAGGESA